MKTALRLTVVTLLLAVSNLSAATLYVSLESTNPTPPYTNWVTAATNIQDAVNVAATNDVVLVTNGVYPGGVTVTNPLALLSVNGPQFTIVDGGGAVQCASLSQDASLSGFTLTNGLGSGVSCVYLQAFVTNCVIVGNRDFVSGGGAYWCTLYNCTLTHNSAITGGGACFGPLYNCVLSDNSAGVMTQGGNGGGASYCTLYNCTLTHNAANAAPPVPSTTTGLGGGAYECTLYNCIIYDNDAGGVDGGPNAYSSTLNYCWSSDPPFVDYANGNLRLQTNSPCINAGNNAYVSTATDLDGRPRIVSGTVDIGAYEYQGTGSRISYAWLQQYGLPTDGSADFADSDGDGLNNWQEWVCGTDPTNPQSVLRLLSPSITSTNTTVTWQSVAGVNYFLERSTNLASPFMHLASFIMGQAGTTSYADTNAAGAGPLFYRVGVLPSGAN